MVIWGLRILIQGADSSSHQNSISSGKQKAGVLEGRHSSMFSLHKLFAKSSGWKVCMYFFFFSVTVYWLVEYVSLIMGQGTFLHISPDASLFFPLVSRVNTVHSLTGWSLKVQTGVLTDSSSHKFQMCRTNKFQRSVWQQCEYI